MSTEVSRPMTPPGPRTALSALAAVTVAALLAGCSQAIAGTAHVDASAVVPTGTIAGSSGPTGTPTLPSGIPLTTVPVPTAPLPTGGGNLGAVCAALNRAAVSRAFGEQVTLANSLTNGCQIRGASGETMIVAVFDTLSLNDFKRNGTYSNLTVGGHPAIRTNQETMYVARSGDPGRGGLLAAYFIGLHQGDSIAAAILGQLVPKFGL